MGVGDGADDGQAEPVAVRVAGPVVDEPLERLEELPGPIRWHCRPGIGDGQDGVVPRGFGADRHAAAGDVVADRVVDEVGGQPLGQVRVAAHDGPAERGVQPQPAACGLRALRPERPVRDVGQVELVRPVQAVLGGGEVSRASTRRSCCSPAVIRSSQVPRRSAAVAPGSASATSSSARLSVSGVRSSWDAGETGHGGQGDAGPDGQPVQVVFALGDLGHGLVREPQLGGGRLAPGVQCRHQPGKGGDR
jgi:hypothetical protein